MASKLAPEAPEGGVLRRFSRGCRSRLRNGPAGAPEALLGGSGGAEPPREDEWSARGQLSQSAVVG
eukprot:15459005-Alexandrium_andersonii.AAC.1